MLFLGLALLLRLGWGAIVTDNGHGIVTTLDDMRDVTLLQAPYMAGCCGEVEFHEQERCLG